MLNREREDSRSNDIIVRSLLDNPSTNSLAIGCVPCPLLGLCRGLHVAAPLFDCLDLCCGNPEDCSRHCRNNPAYVRQVREIGGFGLGNVPRAPEIPIVFDYDVVPLIYHGARRARALEGAAFALRPRDLVNFRTGELRFGTRAALDEAFCISANADLVLSGVDFDHRIEPWWSLGERRESLLINLHKLGVRLVTSPNFSVTLDRPRTNDLHSIKRIGLIFSEFQNAGFACALHPNGRTMADFDRWSEFVAERREVSMLAYEFITGPARVDRMGTHLEHLKRIAARAQRELDIIVRGDPRVIPVLRSHYRRVIYIETSSFVKSVRRQRALRVRNNALKWRASPTTCDTELDKLFEHNFKERRSLLRSLYYGGPPPVLKAA